MSIDILPSFLSMINLGNNAIWRNHWIATDMIAYHRIGPVLNRINHKFDLRVQSVETVIARLRTIATRVRGSFIE